MIDIIQLIIFIILIMLIMLIMLTSLFGSSFENENFDTKTRMDAMTGSFVSGVGIPGILIPDNQQHQVTFKYRSPLNLRQHNLYRLFNSNRNNAIMVEIAGIIQQNYVN